MKKIDKWVARDGSEWKTEDDARNRETLLDKIDEIESWLPSKPDDISFTNGHGYIQHSKKVLERARAEMTDLACKHSFSDIYKYDIHSYAFGRYLEDSDMPLYKLYIRIVLCVDDNTWREYGQTYYANHSDEAEQICLNGVR